MAPRTRSSAAAAKNTSPSPLKRREISTKDTTSGSNSASSASSAPTPTTTISDSEYSTPATSNAVTPAPSVPESSALKSASRPRLVVELPDIPFNKDSSDSEPKAFGSTSRSTRHRPGPIAYVDDSEGEDEEFFPNDNSHGSALARKLQQEEGQRVKASSLNCPIALSLFMSLAPPRKAPDGFKKRGGFIFTKSKSTITGKKRRSVVISDVASARAHKKPKIAISDGDESSEPESEFVSDSESEYEESIADVAEDSAKESGEDTSHAGPPPPNNQPVPPPNNQPAPAPTATPQPSEELRDPVPIHFKNVKRKKLEANHPEITTMWNELETMPLINAGKATQPTSIKRALKPFQLEGLAWMKAMEGSKWKGGLLGDEMGLGKTIQAVSLVMSDYPAKAPTLVLVPPVALMQWTSEIESYTDGQLKTLVFHGTNLKAKKMSVKELKKFDVIMLSYNTLESLYRKQEKGFKRGEGTYKESSAIHQIKFHRIILDEAHCIKSRQSMTAKACFALKVEYRWCLTGTPLQNRIGEFFSLLRFLRVTPFASYLCGTCPCSHLEWNSDDDNRCVHCSHPMIQHISVFNQELLNPIMRYGNRGDGNKAFKKLRLLTSHIMLRRLKKDYTNAMELPVKEIYVNRQFFGEEESDLAKSIMTNSQRKFDTYVAQGVLLNNYANVFGLIMQMRQVADHPDLVLKKTSEAGQNVLVCCICDEPAEDAIRSKCKHDFCRSCAKSYVNSQGEPDCPQCHISLSIDLEQPEIEQDELLVKKSSIINRIKMENWTSSSKIELLVHELHRMRSDNASQKSIIFSQFTTMLQLIEWRLRRAGITTVMLDGSMTPAQRQASINHFMQNVDVECFLVSLKAGGVALNLTEASRVFIVDPWWNPAAEWQSADRCHRIGQTRPCIITRLCIEDSVESRMVLLQEKKTSMINSTVNADEASMEALTPDDLQFLFRGT